MNQPIRILHVVTIMNLGGIETFLMTLYRNIDRTKVQFDFLVHRQDKGFFDDEIKEMGGNIYCIQALKPNNFLSYYKDLSLFFKNNREYSIVHSHLNANSSLVLGIAKKCGVKHRISHAHIDQVGGSNPILKRILRTYINKVSTKRFACSKQAGNWLFKGSDFEVFNNSIDTNRFIFYLEKRLEIRKKLHLTDSTIVIGNIARFNEQKNHDFMLDIFASYLKINSNSKLLLIGDGELMNICKNKANSLNILDDVIFTGSIGNANDYLNSMDLFLFPSLYEGLGIVAVEAQCNGLPVLMTDTLPKDVEITNLITRLSLDVTPIIWAKKIDCLVSKQKNRKGFEKIIVDNGYDIHENAKKITNYYLSLN